MRSDVLTFGLLLFVTSLFGVQSSKIFNGNDAKQNEFPFVVYTNTSRTPHSCTGSLIDRRWVLTAAHCIYFGGDQVILGDYERPGVAGNEQVIAIEFQIRHPEYGFLTNDIGLMKLAEPANVRSDTIAKIQPLESKAFMKKVLANEKNCRVLGWGTVYNYEEEMPETARKLQKMNVRFVNESEYVARGYDYILDYDGAFVYEKEYTDSCGIGGLCYGDSGGPVVCRKNGNWVVVGVNSFIDAKDGCMRGLNGAVNIPLYYSWIQAVMSQY